ncbi:MAG: hypothetical protein AAFQ68_06165, partial [Bacteroidota bacterium]
MLRHTLVFLLPFCLLFLHCQTDNQAETAYEVETESGLEQQPERQTPPPATGPASILPYEIGEERDLGPEAQLAYQAEWDHFDYLSKQMEEGKMPSTFSAEDQEFLRNFDETRSQTIYYVGALGDSWYNGGGPYKLSASSSLEPNAPNSYYPDNAHDFDLSTAWIEGADDYGEGEYIEYFFREGTPPVTEIHIYNGYTKSNKSWEDNSRVKTLKLSVNGREKALLHLEDTRGKQKFQLGEELQSKSGDLVLRFEIVDVYPGAKYQDTGFAELEFDGTGVLCLGAGTPIMLADRSLKAIEAIKPDDQVLSWDEAQQAYRTSRVE